MTAEEAAFVVGLIREGAAYQDLPDVHVRELAKPLVVLPFETCRRNVERWSTEPRLDARGMHLPKFVSSVDDVLDAVGLSRWARPLVDRALRDGGLVLPSLRGQYDGWEYVPPDGALPQGVAEAIIVAGGELPAGARVERLALVPPAQPAPRSDEPMPLGAALAVIGQGLQARKNAALRRSYETWRDGPPAEPALDRERMPPVLRQAVEAAEAERDRLEQARQRCAAQERAYRELCDELRGQLRDRVVDSHAARSVATEILRHLAADPLQGVEAVVEVLRDALAPGLAIAKAEVVRGANPDEFDDAPGAIEAVRISLRRRSQ